MEHKLKIDYTERPIELFNTMGCRTINGLDVNALDNFKRNVGKFIEGKFDEIDDVFSGAQKDGRGNICPVTIILPTLAMISKQKIDKKIAKLSDEEREKIGDADIRTAYWDTFMKLLDKKIYEAKDALIERFNHITSQTAASGKFMYGNHTMAGYHEEEGIISAIKHGTLVIGQIGIAETLLILRGYTHTCDEGMRDAKEIEQLYFDRCAEFKKEYKLNFGVYYTPAENLCYTAMKGFKKRFPEFEMENVTHFVGEDGKKIDKLYFTNSMHVPVWEDVDAFEKIDIESQLTGYNSAGAITYVELPSTCFNNLEAVEQVVDYAMEHDIPYFAINIPINRCSECNEPIWDESAGCCPKCGNEEIVRLGRITGYLSTTVEHFNNGKKAEFYDRVKHFKN